VIATTDYELVTQSAGLVVRSQRAIFELIGGESAEFLHSQVTNDIEALEPGEGCYAALLDHKGKIRTDMRVLALAPDRLLLDSEAMGREALRYTFETYSLGRDVSSRDLSEERTVVSLLGPDAGALLDTTLPGAEHGTVERALGVYATTDLGVDVIASVESLGAVRAIAPEVGEDVAECLRIEAGRPRLGLDMDGGTIPQEAGLNERAVSFTKGCYVGQETVARLFYRGKPNRHLRGLRLDEAPEHGSPIVLGQRQVGVVGSSACSPLFGPIALALVRREAEPGAAVEVGGRPATVVELPFVAG